MQHTGSARNGSVLGAGVFKLSARTGAKLLDLYVSLLNFSTGSNSHPAVSISLPLLLTRCLQVLSGFGWNRQNPSLSSAGLTLLWRIDRAGKLT
jgi:hypothetical protein